MLALENYNILGKWVESIMKKFSFILLSGGQGTRTGLDYPKQFFLINGHPMLAYPLIIANTIDEIDEIIVNFPYGYEKKTKEIIEAYITNKKVKMVKGGETRQESTRLLCEAAVNDYVIIHEAARPTISIDDVKNLMSHNSPNVSFCAKISFSLCQVDLLTNDMIKSIDRDTTLNIQLPQKFDRKLLLAAHYKALERKVFYNEDAMLCREQGNCEVKYILGNSANIKITTFEEFKFAETLLKGIKND